MMCLRWLYVMITIACSLATTSAQQYTGISGLLHVPSAEMHREGDARIVGQFMNRDMTPGRIFQLNGKKYHTFDYYLAITPFKWVEASYVCTAFLRNSPNGKRRFKEKDRYFSLKVNPLTEGKYWPAIAFGCNDWFDSRSGVDGNGEGGELYFANLYVAATKHFHIGGNEVGTHLAYRHFKRDYNHRWNGMVGGLTIRPASIQNLRAIVEWTGNEINVGADYNLWHHWAVQASVWNGKHFFGGVCYYLNLF